MASNDLTNRQLLDALEELLDERLKPFATKDDLETVRGEIAAVRGEVTAVRGGLEAGISRLERKIDGNQAVNISHHLETREAVGQLNSDLTKLREGLAQASGLA